MPTAVPAGAWAAPGTCAAAPGLTQPHTGKMQAGRPAARCQLLLPLSSLPSLCTGFLVAATVRAGGRPACAHPTPTPACKQLRRVLIDTSRPGAWRRPCPPRRPQPRPAAFSGFWCGPPHIGYFLISVSFECHKFRLRRYKLTKFEVTTEKVGTDVGQRSEQKTQTSKQSEVSAYAAERGGGGRSPPTNAPDSRA